MAHKTDGYWYISKIERIAEAYMEIVQEWC